MQEDAWQKAVLIDEEILQRAASEASFVLICGGRTV
jgi:hypothetical protein